MIKSRIFAICAGSILLCASVFGQNGGGLPSAAEMASHEVERLTDQLSLTSEQQAAATTAFTNQQTAMATMRASMEAARKALTAAIIANDSAAIQTAAAQMGTLSVQETVARSTAQAAIYASLNSSQQAKYVKMLSGGPRGGFGPGGGGPGGRGPGGPPPMN